MSNIFLSAVATVDTLSIDDPLTTFSEILVTTLQSILLTNITDTPS